MANKKSGKTARNQYEPDDDSFDDLFDENEFDEDGLEASEDLRRLSIFRQDEYRIVDFKRLVELGDEDEEEDRRIEPEVDFATLLHQLLSGSGKVPLANLYALSDLSRANMETLRQQWPSIPVEQRRAVVSELTAAAADDVSLHLGRLLRIALTDSDARVRQSAVEGLWDDEDSDLIGPFVQMLRNDPDVGVRAAAATALGAYVLAGELDELDAVLAMRAEESLLAVLHNEAEMIAVRRRALESIAFSGEVGIRQLIEDAFYSTDEEMRVSALRAMGRSADVRWRSMVRSELHSPSPEMRAEAAFSAGELEIKDALRDLLLLLDDEVQSVKLAAIFALGRLGGREAREALEILSGSDDETEAEAAEQALEEMSFYADPDGIPLFDESDEDDEWWELQDDE